MKAGEWLDLTELMKQFGLTKQEAVIYFTLLSESALTGYEIAKITGISRSNVYTSLAALVEKGCAYTIEETSIKYTPVPLDEFCNNKIKKLMEIKNILLSNMPAPKSEVEGYITIKGKENILNKAKNMISNAEYRLYLSAPDKILKLISDDIKKAAVKGLKVVLITDVPVNFEGAEIYITKNPSFQIRLITDSSKVLTGDLNDDDFSTCLYSEKKNLIDLLKDSIKNEIKLIKIEKGAVEL